MAYSLKEQLSKEERFVGGHRLCAGCGAGITVRAVLRALEPEDKAVITNATGCLEVSSFLYPYTAYTDSYIHCAFENAAATCGGVEAAYNVLKRKGKIQDNFKFITFGGDGGTYDIGFQSLSGAMERGHDMVYVCYDNEAYMNTGIQRSSSTPRFTDATTTPVGKVSYGKKQNKKDLTEIIDGEWHLNYMPKKKLPVEEFMKLQGRFKHCFKPGNEWTIEAAQQYVDEKWEKLLARCGK